MAQWTWSLWVLIHNPRERGSGSNPPLSIDAPVR